MLSLPGGVFEVGIALWLLVKGFRREAYADGFRTPATGARLPQPAPVAS